MEDNKVIGVAVGVVIVTFLLIGLSAILVQGKEYYENTEVLEPGSQTVQKINLLGGDTVRTETEVSENRSVQFLVMRENKLQYNITTSDMNLTITVPQVTKTVSYRFVLKNPQEQPVRISYLYEVTLMHNFWMGVMWLAIAAILGVAAFFALRE
ncbi:hypothetical protein AKJ65_07820 [candidate division MSBL1 archaeon SCGC-AAA259E19]|uniref:Uncharacterized protein n=1 Tax=candidate division MSBL1 archaeon SCGC-AAA259E19 TaxID=1698264 RepID=A0A133UDM7_9EURY|nr:hypothetical protein AKJ65_07820 [candidate division MSBL1 archaeon SCGC-AAA259E19]